MNSQKRIFIPKSHKSSFSANYQKQHKLDSSNIPFSKEKDIIMYRESMENDDCRSCNEEVDSSIKYDPKMLSSMFTSELDTESIQKPMAVYGHLMTTDQQENVSMFCDKNSPSLSENHNSKSTTFLDSWTENMAKCGHNQSQTHQNNINVHSNCYNCCNLHMKMLCHSYSSDSIETQNCENDSQQDRHSSQTSTTNLLTIASQKLYELVSASNENNRPDSVSSSSDTHSYHHLFGNDSLINYEISRKNTHKSIPLVISSEKTTAVRSATTPVVFLCRPQESRVLLRMSISLIKTYQIINEIYYCKKRRRTNEHMSSDDSFHRETKRFLNTCNCSNSELVQSFKEVDSHSKKLHHHHHHRHGHHHHPVKPEEPAESLPKRRHHRHVHSNHNHHKHLFDQKEAKKSAYEEPIPKCPNCTTLSTVAKEYLVKPGEIWMNRYSMDLLIGTGSFGQVVRANDLSTGEQVAIKIIRNRRSFVQQAETEIRLLRMLARYQEDHDGSSTLHWGSNCIVRLKSHFMYRGHLCLVFELLTYSLYELLKNTGFCGVSLNLTRKFGLQLCYALHFLSQSSIQIIHCDLKPENVLLLHPKRSAIKVVDFGSSCRLNERLFVYIQSRFYRAPEVLLYLPYNMAIDMWSLGCILVELHTGQPLFVGQFEHEQILRIIEVVGMPPDHIIRSSKRANKYFIESPPQANESGEIIPGCFEPKVFRNRDGKKIPFEGVGARKLSDIIGVETGGPGGRRKDETGHSLQDYTCFLDLIERMLTFDSSKRITPDEALKHPFFCCAENNSTISSVIDTTSIQASPS